MSPSRSSSAECSVRYTHCPQQLCHPTCGQAGHPRKRQYSLLGGHGLACRCETPTNSVLGKLPKMVPVNRLDMGICRREQKEVGQRGVLRCFSGISRWRAMVPAQYVGKEVIRRWFIQDSGQCHPSECFRKGGGYVIGSYPMFRTRSSQHRLKSCPDLSVLDCTVVKGQSTCLLFS